MRHNTKAINAYRAYRGLGPEPSITPSCFGRRQPVDLMARCANDVRRFEATGELPPPWTPEIDEEFDARVDEMNRDLESEGIL